MLAVPSARAAHRAGATLLTLLVTALLAGAGTGRAQAADGYTYWNYFHVKAGRYVFATTGPSGFTPKDGSVEAYRYGLSSTASGIAPRTPAATYSVEDICAGQKAGAGQKRVGVLIDYGTTAEAARGETPPKPRAACAVVATKATGQQVLDSVADLRLSKQLLCGIDGYPVRTCSVTVKHPPAATRERPVHFALPAAASTTPGGTDSSSSSESDDGGVPWPLVGVLAAVLVIGGGALALGRRNKNA